MSRQTKTNKSKSQHSKYSFVRKKVSLEAKVVSICVWANKLCHKGGLIKLNKVTWQCKHIASKLRLGHSCQAVQQSSPIFLWTCSFRRQVFCFMLLPNLFPALALSSPQPLKYMYDQSCTKIGGYLLQCQYVNDATGKRKKDTEVSLPVVLHPH